MLACNSDEVCRDEAQAREEKCRVHFHHESEEFDECALRSFEYLRKCVGVALGKCIKTVCCN